jgi:phosphoadenosine phosphosulfate reductase
MIDAPIRTETLVAQSLTAWNMGLRMLQPWRFDDTDETHIALLLEVFNPPRFARVLDVGCGFGETARLMAQQRPGLDFVLLNVVQEQLDRAPESFERVCGNAHDLPFPDASFDALMFNAALCNMDARVALAEAARVLKPSGVLFLNELLRNDGDNAALEDWAGARAFPHDALVAVAESFGLGLDYIAEPDQALDYLRGVSADTAAHDAAFAGVSPGLWRFTRSACPLPVAARVARTIARHDRIALQVSGGKDSLALLYLLRPWWDRLCVYWLNTGDAYPEMVRRMAMIRDEVPNFREVAGNQPEIIAAGGWPSDVVPHLHTTAGNAIFGATPFKVQSRLDCCWRALMLPMHLAIKEDGVTLVIRGKRADEADKTGIESGHVEDGVEALFPIMDWTADEVFNYLHAEGIEVPPFYEYADSSLDCMHCTAWLEHRNGNYLRAKHPETFVEYERRIGLIARAVKDQMKGMEHGTT